MPEAYTEYVIFSKLGWIPSSYFLHEISTKVKRKAVAPLAIKLLLDFIIKAMNYFVNFYS